MWLGQGGDLLFPETEPPRGAGGEVLHEDVGLRHELAERLLGVFLLEVEGEGLLGAVEPDEVARHAVDGPVVGSGEVAGAGALDLYDPRAEVGELAEGKVGGEEPIGGLRGMKLL